MITSHRYSDDTCTCRHCAAPVVARINAQFAARDLAALTAEQIDCLCDPDRASEAWDMLDHWDACDWIVGSERGEVATFLIRHEMPSRV